MGLWIGFELSLLDFWHIHHAGLSAADDDRGNLFAGGSLVLSCRVILRGTKVGEILVGALTKVGQGTDV